MSAVVLNPVGREARPPSIVRILCNKCFGNNAEHARCPGVLQSKGVRFECTCKCHVDAQLPLIDGKMTAAGAQ